MTTSDDIKVFVNAYRDRCIAKALRGEWLTELEYNEARWTGDLSFSWFEKKTRFVKPPLWRIRPEFLSP